MKRINIEDIQEENTRLKESIAYHKGYKDGIEKLMNFLCGVNETDVLENKNNIDKEIEIKAIKLSKSDVEKLRKRFRENIFDIRGDM